MYRVRVLIEFVVGLGTTLLLVVIDTTHIVIQAVCNTIVFCSGVPRTCVARAKVEAPRVRIEYGAGKERSKLGKKYVCPVCGKSFNQSGNLNRHRVVHTKERPFRCNICGKGFSQKSHVRTHQTVHTGVKAFECHICRKRFSQLGHLNGHLDRHRRQESGMAEQARGADDASVTA